MKILHIQQYFNEGLGYQENILPYYQQKLGHEVIMITSTRSDGFNNENRIKIEEEFIENGFRVKRIKIKGEFKKRFVIFNDLEVVLNEEQPDYIFHHSVTSPSLKVISRYKKKNPSCFIAVDNHADLSISGKNKIWKFFYYNLFWKKFLKVYDSEIDIYFGVTPSRCLFLEEELGVDSEKIRFLPIGADLEKANVKLSKTEFLKKYNLNENMTIITHGGKITPKKQVDKIVKAIQELKEENVRLILFGSIEDKNVEDLIAQDKRIIFLGWLNREDTLTLLKYSDIGIWNTQHTTLLEDAVAVGLPLILRYYGSTAHLINQNGIFLYEGSKREINDALNLLIHSPNLISFFKENAINIREDLSYDRIAKESLEYVNDLSPKPLHRKYMNSNFNDLEYPYFRKLKSL